ncbi:MAG TPA: methyltransferase domain-containing protein [Acidimicrobiales bacterium]|nr:methyltransferase domain-containing protein [Acidimicrobiales bacterium]
MDSEAGVQVGYRVARAEATRLEGSVYNVFSAGQCWHWFDGRSAAREAHRLLRAGGTMLICHFDWLPLPGSVAEVAETVILRHNPQWGGAGGSGMYPQWAADVAGAGFSGIETFSYDVDVTYTHEAWRAAPGPAPAWLLP